MKIHEEKSENTTFYEKLWWFNFSTLKWPTDLYNL